MWIEDRKDGKYNYFERYTDPYTEKSRKVSILLESKSNRAKKEAQKMLDLKIEKKLNDLNSSDITFTSLLEKWWKFYKQEIKRSSISSMESNLKQVKSSFAVDVKVKNIDVLYVQNYFDNMDGSRSKKERHKTIINLVFDYAISNRMIKENPSRLAKLPKIKKTLDDVKKVRDKFLEDDEIKPLLEELYRRPNTYRLGLASEFMSINGCRFGELISIEPENVNRKEMYIDIIGTLDKTDGYKNGIKTIPKTAASYRRTFSTKREIEIIDEMIMLNDLEKNLNPKYVDRGFIFTTKNGVPLQINSFNLALKNANLRLETPIQKNLSSHIFRHTLVSRLASHNVPLKAIMDRVGHSESRTTSNIYTHVTKQMSSNVIKILDTY